MPSRYTPSPGRPEAPCTTTAGVRLFGLRQRARKLTGIIGPAIEPEWLVGVQAFIDYMGQRPTPGHRLGRLDLTRGYVKGNLVWQPKRTRTALFSAERFAYDNLMHRVRNTIPSTRRRGVNPRIIHPAWARSFTVWLRDVGKRPSPDHRLCCLKPELGYVPGNLVWVLRPYPGQGKPRKLTWEAVELIRADMRPDRHIARTFGVSRTTVRKIQAGVSWRGAAPPPAADAAPPKE